MSHQKVKEDANLPRRVPASELAAGARLLTWNDFSAEIDRFSARWRGTDRLIEQRMTLLVAAATVSLTAVGLGSTGTIGPLAREGIFMLNVLIGVGTYLRIMRGRLAVIRCILIINYTRTTAAGQLDMSGEAYLKTIAACEFRPKLFQLWSLPTAALASGVAFLALALAGASRVPQMSRLAFISDYRIIAFICVFLLVSGVVYYARWATKRTRALERAIQSL